MRIYISFFLILILIFYSFNCKASEETEISTICPLCSYDAKLICPIGFTAICEGEDSHKLEPKCIFYENKYMPGCWKFAGINKINLNLVPANMPPSTMIKIIGGGETYTFNREIIGCKKL